jgi:ferric-dicitrate binding protein FerR (iron transport regulator)
LTEIDIYRDVVSGPLGSRGVVVSVNEGEDWLSMEDESEDVMDPIWDRAVELVIEIHDSPGNPEHFDSLVHWLNESPAHLKAFNELGQIWISAGIALAREIGQPLSELEQDQRPLMMH